MAHYEDKKQNMRAFKLDEPEYDMNTYSGRVKHFFQVFNPM
jgi:hypothetical protein